jgi:hypothetical protein
MAAMVPPPLEGSAEFIGPVKPRSGHLAVFISRKENKIFVRQNFEPWFEAPVAIAASDRPLGTHVFTVRADKADADALRWSVVSLPAPPAPKNPAPQARQPCGGYSSRPSVVAEGSPRPADHSRRDHAADRLGARARRLDHRVRPWSWRRDRPGHGLHRPAAVVAAHRWLSAAR